MSGLGTDVIDVVDERICVRRLSRAALYRLWSGSLIRNKLKSSKNWYVENFQHCSSHKVDMPIATSCTIGDLNSYSIMEISILMFSNPNYY